MKKLNLLDTSDFQAFRPLESIQLNNDTTKFPVQSLLGPKIFCIDVFMVSINEVPKIAPEDIFNAHPLCSKVIRNRNFPA